MEIEEVKEEVKAVVASDPN